MPVDQRVTINLDQAEIGNFIIDDGQTQLENPESHDDRAEIANDGFVSHGATKRRQMPDHEEVFSTEVVKYQLIERETNAIVGDLEGRRIFSNELRIDLIHELWLKDGLTPDEIDNIESSFNEFDPENDGDPIEYLQSRGIKNSDGYVYSTFSMKKVDKQRLVDSDGRYADHDEYIRSYYRQLEKYILQGVNAFWVIGVSNPDDGAIEVDDPEDSSTVGEGLEDRFGDIADCGKLGFKKEPKRVTTLFQYPEFKTEWKPKRVKIGCSRITIRLPVLMTRTRKRVLWAVVVYAIDLGQFAERVIIRCLQQSALAGTLAGVATANIAVAVAVFKAQFTECIKRHSGEFSKCLIPNLEVRTEKTPWARF